VREENWPAVLGIVSGVLAKEVIVGTLDSLYTRLAVEAEPEPAAGLPPFSLSGALAAAAATVPANLADTLGSLSDPLGLRVGDLSDQATVAAAQKVHTGTFGAMEARFDGREGAFAYLLFVLLYFPCVATIGAIIREAGAPWAGFVAAWTTGIAFATATLFYQAATFDRHPLTSGAWMVGLGVTLAMVVLALRVWARSGRGDAAGPRAAGVRA
jgi:ferrous iron transport protein B